MFASRGFFGSGILKPQLTDRNLLDSNTGASPASAYATFGTTGSLSTKGFVSRAVDGEWMSQLTTAAECQKYDLVVVKNSGTLTYGAAGTYQLGISALKFGCYVDANSGSQISTCTFTIRRRSDNVVMATADMQFWAESSNM